MATHAGALRVRPLDEDFDAAAPVIFGTLLNGVRPCEGSPARPCMARSASSNPSRAAAAAGAYRSTHRDRGLVFVGEALALLQTCTGGKAAQLIECDEPVVRGSHDGSSRGTPPP